jgi:hypothetical protein
MSTSTPAAPKSEFRLFLELFLVVGLPVLAVFAASTLAFVAYTRGFTALPEQPAQSAQHR